MSKHLAPRDQPLKYALFLRPSLGAGNREYHIASYACHWGRAAKVSTVSITEFQNDLPHSIRNLQSSTPLLDLLDQRCLFEIAPSLTNQDVFRLDIPMHDMLFVEVR